MHSVSIEVVKNSHKMSLFQEALSVDITKIPRLPGDGAHAEIEPTLLEPITAVVAANGAATKNCRETTTENSPHAGIHS